VAAPAHEFPRTAHVIVALIVSFVVFGVMMFWSVPYLRHVAGGLEPFDGRVFGYTVEEARALLTALSDIGRNFYADVQLQIDTVFPAIYALSRMLLLLWLTAPGRLAAHVPLAIRIALLVPPILTAWFDYFENNAIAAMLVAGPQVSADLAARASFWTQTKWVAALLTEASCVILLAAVFVRWMRRRQRA
jgi:hypothetical protein